MSLRHEAGIARGFRGAPHVRLTSMALVAAAAVLTALAPPPAFEMKWGSFGAAAGQFNTPFGIATSVSGEVFVADRMNHRIQVFDANGQFLRSWGSSGTGHGQFNQPAGVVASMTGVVYVSEASGNRIQKFDEAGQFMTMWGSVGSRDGQFRSPAGMAIDTAGNLHVADQFNNRIQVFDADGGFLRAWGSSGTGPGQFKFPIDVAIDAGGHQYIVEFSGHRLQKFDAAGAFMTTWGSQGSADGQFNQPTAVETDATGGIFVTDSFNHRVQKFTAAGIFETAWGGLGSANSQFNQLGGLAIDFAGDLYVVDRFNHRVQRFGWLAANLPPVAEAGADRHAECTSPGGTDVALDGSASSDPDGDPLVYAWTLLGNPIGDGPTPIVQLPPGVHVVRLTVTDPHGESGTDDVIVEVEDSTPPALTALTASPAVLDRPKRQMVPVTIGADVTDCCDPTPVCEITGVRSSDPPGRNGPDWVVTGPLTVSLRAEPGRRGRRTYWIDVECVDAAGHAAAGVADVQVYTRRGH